MFGGDDDIDKMVKILIEHGVKEDDAEDRASEDCKSMTMYFVRNALKSDDVWKVLLGKAKEKTFRLAKLAELKAFQAAKKGPKGPKKVIGTLAASSSSKQQTKRHADVQKLELVAGQFNVANVDAVVKGATRIKLVGEAEAAMLVASVISSAGKLSQEPLAVVVLGHAPGGAEIVIILRDHDGNDI